MKKSKLILISLLFVQLLGISSLRAQDKKGVYLGVTGTLGGIFGENSTNDFGGGGGLRLGYGFNDKFLIYANADSFFLGDGAMLEFGLNAQYYFTENLYASLGASYFAGFEGDDFGVEQDSWFYGIEGISINAAVGYEVAISERAFIAPELRVKYRIDTFDEDRDVDVWSVEGGVTLGIHF